MSNIILISVISITTALVLYTIAIWRNWRHRELTNAQVVLLWLGLFCDALATRMMAASVEQTTWDLHTISGYAGLALMAALAVAGAWARWSDNQRLIATFHQYALPVWVIWSVSFVTGVWIGMNRV